MWDIRLEKQNDYDCILGLIVQFAKHKLLDYEMAFMGLWSFSYETKEKSTIGLSIKMNYNPILKQNLDLFHGITMVGTSLINIDYLKYYVNQNISFSPIIISLNAYDCPWSLAYKKYKIDHHIMITGMNKDLFLCVDSYFAENGILLLPFSLLSDWSGDTAIFQLHQSKQLNRDYIQQVINAVDYVKMTNMINHLGMFKAEMTSLETYDNEISNKKNDYYAVPLINKVHRMSTSRKCFLRGLQYICNNLGHRDLFEKSICSFESCINSYMVLENTIIRQMLKQTVDKDIIREKIESIIEKEKKNILYMEELSSNLCQYLDSD
ncbi:MAG: hypothetical protein A2Y40_06630 [Candidatus Margulisbacteria bacterium GWF2_35_9]|nr:MAG: hypothetical protein A2Y40_06630 [Candidatus Margulisbacteria bacterium GWF2_35_9]